VRWRRRGVGAAINRAPAASGAARPPCGATCPPINLLRLRNSFEAPVDKLHASPFLPRCALTYVRSRGLHPAQIVVEPVDLHRPSSAEYRTRALYDDAQWPAPRAPRHRPARDVFVLLAVGRGAPPGHPPPSQPHHRARGAHGLLSRLSSIRLSPGSTSPSIRRLLDRRRAPDPPSLLQRYLRAVRRTRLLQSPWRATPVLHARYFAHGSGLRITGGRGLHPAGQQQLHPRRSAPRRRMLVAMPECNRAVPFPRVGPFTTGVYMRSALATKASVRRG